MTKYAVVDCETSGVALDCTVIEVGVIVLNDDLSEQRRVRWRKRPSHFVRRSMWIDSWLRAHSPLFKPDFEDEGDLSEVLSLVKAATFVIGHNVHFDVSCLERLAGTRVARRCIDTGSVAWSKGLPVRLGDLCVALGVDYSDEGAHDALYDAERTAECLRRMTTQPSRVIEQWRHNMSFGPNFGP